MKNDTIPTDGTLTGIFDKSKTDVGKTKVSTTKVSTEVDKIEVSKTRVLTTNEHKIVEDAKIIDVDHNSIIKEGCSSVDEVVATSTIDTLSYECAKNDWTFDVSIGVVTIKLVEDISELDVSILARE